MSHLRPTPFNISPIDILRRRREQCRAGENRIRYRRPQNYFLYLVLPQGQAMRYGVGVGREGFGCERKRHDPAKSRVAKMDATGRDGRTRPKRERPGPKACRAVRKIRSARGRCISFRTDATRFTASMAQSNLAPSASRCRAAASACSIRMSSISIAAFRSEAAPSLLQSARVFQHPAAPAIAANIKAKPAGQTYFSSMAARSIGEALM